MTEFRRTELAAELLAAADRLIKESDFWGAQARLGSYLSDVLWDALREPSDEAARRVLHSSGFVDRLRQFATLTAQQMGDRMFRLTHLPGYLLLTFAQTAWWLGESTLGDQLLEQARTKESLASASPFWREVASGLGALVAHEPYAAKPVKTRGAESYLLPYLDLIEALAMRRDPSDAIAAVQDSISRRNADRRITDTGADFDGNPSSPVRANLRLRGILARFDPVAWTNQRNA